MICLQGRPQATGMARALIHRTVRCIVSENIVTPGTRARINVPLRRAIVCSRARGGMKSLTLSVYTMPVTTQSVGTSKTSRK